MTANKNESTQPSSGSDATKKTYETFDYPPSAPNANSLPGADANTAGGRPPQYATLTDAFKTIRLEHFKEVHKKPCARESFLTAIGAGFGVGGARFVLGGPVFSACSWAVATFTFTSFGMYEYCQRKRQIEKSNVRQMQEALEESKRKKMVEQVKKREEARKAREKAREEAERSASSSWAFWRKSG
ncbi:MAG: hypothetical protein LQ350_001240 [Teloschistes chrysophthalmus]|nr:MAG: hypothetical protein LQ350_001240 [Niorma chrysophthalma]